VLFFVIRPIAVVSGLAGIGFPKAKVALLSWFGIRGIGSLYYLMFAIGMGVEPGVSIQLVSVTLWVIASSIVVHGISVTPLMRWYHAKRGGHARAKTGA
jgi:NhaP-type Na+/H+ or K+/H+ antiporter